MINNILQLFIGTVYAGSTDLGGNGNDPITAPPTASNATNEIVGKIELPSGVISEVSQTGSFITVIIRFFIIIGGIFTLWQFLSGGFTYITSNGDKAKVQEAGNKITMAIIGLVIMAASFVIIAIVSKLLFGDFTYILIPKFQSVN